MTSNLSLNPQVEVKGESSLTLNFKSSILNLNYNCVFAVAVVVSVFACAIDSINYEIKYVTSQDNIPVFRPTEAGFEQENDLIFQPEKNYEAICISMEGCNPFGWLSFIEKNMKNIQTLLVKTIKSGSALRYSKLSLWGIATPVDPAKLYQEFEKWREAEKLSKMKSEADAELRKLNEAKARWKTEDDISACQMAPEAKWWYRQEENARFDRINCIFNNRDSHSVNRPGLYDRQLEIRKCMVTEREQEAGLAPSHKPVQQILKLETYNNYFRINKEIQAIQSYLESVGYATIALNAFGSIFHENAEKAVSAIACLGASAGPEDVIKITSGVKWDPARYSKAIADGGELKLPLRLREIANNWEANNRAIRRYAKIRCLGNPPELRY